MVQAAQETRISVHGDRGGNGYKTRKKKDNPWKRTGKTYPQTASVKNQNPA
jgi:hypothetical protein